MKNKTPIPLVILALISHFAMAQSIEQAISFQESLRIALEKNPKPKSKDIQILALKDRTAAAWLGFLPTLNETCSSYQDKSTTRKLGISSPSKDTTNSCTTSVDLNLFTGGRNYYSAKTADAQQKARAALFNSTNPLVENSKGALATLLVSTYTNIIMNQDFVELNNSRIDILNRAIATTSDPDDISAYTALIDTANIEQKSALDKIALDKEDYLYEVTQEAPQRLDSFDDFIASFIIPSTPEEALAQAKSNSPDLKRRVYELKAAEYAVKIAWSQAYMPNLDAYYSNTYLNDTDRLDAKNNYNYRDQMAGLTLSWTFSLQKNTNVSATKKELQSAQLEQQAVMDDLKHNIKKTYMNFEASSSTLEGYRLKFQKAKDKVYNDLDRLESKAPVARADLINDLNDFRYSGNSLIYSKQGVVMLKFTIQQVTGALFSSAMDSF